MRTFKLVGALMVVMAFSAIAVATASAAEKLWHWLPGAEGTAFTGNSGKSTLQLKGGLSIISPKSTTTGEITKEATLGLATITFKESTTTGLPVNSLGDASGIIKAHLELHTCEINGTERGIKIEILPLHLEVPSTKLLIKITGALIAKVTPFETSTKKYTVIVEQKEGKQAIEKCEGGVAQTLSTSVDEKEAIQSGQETKEGLIDFTTVAQTAMA